RGGGVRARYGERAPRRRREGAGAGSHDDAAGRPLQGRAAQPGPARGVGEGLRGLTESAGEGRRGLTESDGCRVESAGACRAASVSGTTGGGIGSPNRFSSES